MKPTIAAACALAALSLAACSKSDTAPRPQASEVGAAMPDTSAAREGNVPMTAPDAGATGTVPANGEAPAVAATPAQGTAGGATGTLAPTTDQIPAKK